MPPFRDGPVEIQDLYIDFGITSTVDFYDAHGSLLEIVRTRIRPDLPQQDVLGRVEQNLRSDEHGGQMLRTEWVTQNQRRQRQQTNPSPGYRGRESTAFLLYGQQTATGTSESCRVDRHFVASGYYFQLIAVAFRMEPASPNCSMASELVSWAVEHIRIGQGCGEP